LDEGKVIDGKFVVERRYLTTLLDPVEEPLNSIASAMFLVGEFVADDLVPS
jgi:hypothetical protein